MSKKILIVEDEAPISSLLRMALEEKGFEAKVARDGKEGVELSLGYHPDLILLDLKMPNMDGMTALEQIRHDDWGKDVPVIVLTNLSEDSEDIMEAMTKNKPRFYMVKSDWSIDGVIKKVESELSIPTVSER